jgi:hypothetical protein
MFRNIAIALVAASVLAAPVMAQNSTLSGGSKSSQPSSESPEKADKSSEKSAETAESTEKSAKHHRVARHHRHHGTKAAKYGKSHTGTAMYGKHHGSRTENLAYEGRRPGHGRMSGRHTYGRASKHMHSPSTSPSVD